MEVLRRAPKVYMLEPVPNYFDSEAGDQFIAHALLTTLEQMGFDKDSVVFSVYHQSKPKEKAFARNPTAYSDNNELRHHAIDMLTRETRGDYDTRPADKERDLQRLAELKQAASARANKPTYFFGKASDFTSPIENLNPLYYIRYHPNDAVIGVYDIAKLKELGLDANSSELHLQAEPSLVEEAKILEFHPRFEEEEPS